MKICLDARFLSNKPTGIGEYSEHLINNLAAIDKSNEYIILVSSNYNPRLNVGSNFNIIQYDANPVSLKTLFSLSSFLAKNSIPVFHSLFPLAPLFYKGKLLVTVHDVQPFLPELTLGENMRFSHLVSVFFYQWVYPKVLKRADWLITVSEATKKYLIQLFPQIRDKIVVIHSGVGEEWFEELPAEVIRRATETLQLPEQYILYEGGGRPSKNLHRMLRAFARVRHEQPNLQNLVLILNLYDDGYTGQVKRLIKNLGLTQYVRIINSLRGEERRVLYKQAKLLFFVTKYEGFGFPLLEAQAVGTPVLASTSAALPEISGESALLVDPDNEEEIAAGLIRLLTDQGLYQELINKGYANVQKYSWRHTVTQLLEVYNHLT